MTRQQWWFIAAVLTGLSVFCWAISPVLMPFIVSALFAYVGDPLVDRLENLKLNRSLAVCLVFAVLSVFVIGALFFLIPVLSDQLRVVIGGLPQWIVDVQNYLRPLLVKYIGVDIGDLPIGKIREGLSGHWQQAGDIVVAALKQISSSGGAMLSFVSGLVLIPVVSFYLLRDWDLLVARVRESLPRPWEGLIVKLAGQCDEVLSAFLRGQLLVMLALSLVYSIGLLIAGLELALLIGTLAGLASVVPYMGFAVGIVAAALAAWFQFADWLPLVYVAIVFGIGQMLESMVLTPVLVGDKIGLHPVAVIFALLAGGQLAGFVGLLIALPVAAVIRVLLSYAEQQYLGSSLYLGLAKSSDTELESGESVSGKRIGSNG